MKPARRYVVAASALGWLLLVGSSVHRAMEGSWASFGRRASDVFSRVTLKVSSAERRGMRAVRGGSRRDLLASRYPDLHRREFLLAPDVRLTGAYDGLLPASFSGLAHLEQALDEEFPVIAFYQAWGDRPEHAFPTYLMETIHRLGSVPMVTWEPWVTAFDAGRRPDLGPVEHREFAALASIARGAYDFHVEAWAAAAAAFGRPFFLRFGHEMNDPYRYPWGPQHGNKPEDYIGAWRRLREVFARAGATNAIWVWSPHMAAPWFEYYYPGGEWVDWLGVTVLNYGDTAPWSRWWSFEQITGNAYEKLVDFGKPIMLAEFATVGTDHRAVRWYEQAFRTLDAKCPDVRLVILFNQRRDYTLTPQPIDWSVLQSTHLHRALGDALSRWTAAGPDGTGRVP